MTGLGHVDAGGAPLIQLLSGGVRLIKLSVGPMDNNAYFLLPAAGAGVLIDAANDASRLLAIIENNPIETIVTTHRHHDHVYALAEVARATGARLVAGTPDTEAIADQAGVAAPYGAWTGENIPLGSQSLEVIGLVGHTPGSIALAYAAGDGITHLFTGDSLFPGGPGKTRTPADFASLLDDLETQIFPRFGDDTVVHPGHGDDTTLGDERPHLAEWRARGW